MKKIIGLIAIVLLSLTQTAQALYGLPERPNTMVVDQADLLNADEEAALEADLQSLRASTSIEIAVATISSLENGDINLAANEIFAQWGIGNKEKDTGVLFLIARNDRQARIEVGYGLEGALPDALASSILRNTTFPRFREDAYAQGIIETVEYIKTATQGEALPFDENTGKNTGEDNWILWLAISGFMLLQALVAILQRTKSWWLGGVIGGTIGMGVIGSGSVGLGLLGIGVLGGSILTLGLIISGLILDYIVSKGYVPGRRSSSDGSWTGGGFGSWGGGGSSGGGFGGGSSGGGGASGSW